MGNYYAKYFRCIPLLMVLFLAISFSSKLIAQVNFGQSELNFNGNGNVTSGVTSLMYGPDGRLYVAEYPGTIKILTIQRNGANDYVVTSVASLDGITNIVNHDDDGTPCSGTSSNCSKRETTGLTVTGTAANPVIYVTSSDFRIGSGSGGGNGDIDLDTNSGIITRFTWNGSSWNVVDLVRGLPRSEENHATNGLEFVTINGTDYLIVTSGGITNAGGPSTNFVYTCEYALSAAVISVDLTALEAMPILDDNGRSYVYDIPTQDDPTRSNANGITDPDTPGYNGVDVNDPWGGNDGLNQAMVVPGGPVQILSPGYRNAYDLVVTESGALYVTDNGANGGWGGFPVNEGGGLATNDYDPLEPGSQSSSGGEQINNIDHLEMVTTDLQNYSFGSFYAGHPNPTRANPSGAGLYTAPAQNGTTGAVFRTLIYDPDGSRGAGYTTNPNIGLPANWPPVPVANSVEGDWRGPGISNPDGPDDNPVTLWGTNTNGIDEYTATNFGGAMQGDLLAGVNTGVVRRVELNANGTLQQLTASFLSGIGGNALGISCNSDLDVFPGTIWTGTLNGKIVVFEPQDFVPCINPGEPGYDANADYDSDGYTNQDEEDNGTDPCNGGSQPADFDKSAGVPLISDLNDTDDDADSISDANDPFQLGDPDTAGSDAFTLPISNDLFNDQQGLGGIFGLGLTGLMNNGDTGANWLDWIDRRDDPNDPNPNDVLGGAPGLMTSHMTSGTALGTTNTQEKGYQYGVQTDQNTGTFTVIGNLINFSGPLRLYGNTAAIGGELGHFIGDGTQSNYIKIVITTAGLTALQEINDVPQTPINVPIAVPNRPTSDIVFYFVVDPSNGQVDLQYAIDGGARTSMGTITAQGSILTAIQQSSTDLAVGFIGTSNTTGVELEGTWDFMNVVPNANDFALRINTGGPLTIQNGETYSADQYFSGGRAYRNTSAQVPELYQTERSSPSQTFAYNIPVTNGDYTVILHFAELYWGATGGGPGGIGQRIFDVSIEGSLVLDNYDITADVGPETPVTKSFDINVTDGTLNLDFSALAGVGGVDQPKISAIEIIGGVPQFPPLTVDPIADQISQVGDVGNLSISASGGDPGANFTYGISGQPLGIDVEPTNGQIFGTIASGALNGGPNVDGIHQVTVIVDKPGSTTTTQMFTWTVNNITQIDIVQINTGGPLTIQNGETFSADQYFSGGQAYSNTTAQVPELYQTERSSPSQTFAYNIPVTNGDYTVILHFAELYWGATGGGPGGIGQRIFDVSIEGSLVLDNYDITADVGPETPVTKSFDINVTDGTLNLDFSALAGVGGVDQPKISAIEIIGGVPQFPPLTVDPIADQISQVGDVGNLSISATGGDPGANFTYGISGHPLGIDVEPTNGQIFGTIASGALNGGPNVDGIHQVTVIVDKPGSTTTTQMFTWTVNNITQIDIAQINTGGPLTIQNGETYSADQYFSGGQAYSNTTAQVPELYQTERSSPSQTFAYNIPVTNGDYTVILHFAEIYWGATGGGTGGIGQRIFDVSIEGSLVLDNYDITADVGPETPVTKSFEVVVNDGVLNIDFSALASVGGIDQPKVSAFEIYENTSQYPLIVIDVILDQTNQIGESGNINVSAIGGDPNANFTYSIVGQPAGIDIEPTNGLVYGTINNSAFTGGPNGDGVHNVTIIASKPGSSDDNINFTWTITGTSCTWNDLSDSNYSRFQTRNELLGNKIYVMGGWLVGSPVQSNTHLEIYDIANDSWTIGTDLLLPVTHMGSVVVGDEIWLIGGFVGNLGNPTLLTEKVQIYNTLTNTWSYGPDLPKAIGSAAATLNGNKIHYIGGLDPDIRTDIGDHYILDLANIAAGWAIAAPMPNPRNHHSAETVNGIIYTIGGQIGHNGPKLDVDIVEAYDPNTDSWTSLANLPIARSHFESGTTVHNGKIIIVGGQEETTNYSDDVTQYDPLTNQWTELCNLPNNRLSPLAQVYGDQLIVSGGGINGSTDLIPTTQWLQLESTASQFEWVDKNEIENYAARHECSFVQAGDKFYLLGGRESDLVQSYDYLSNSWLTHSSAPKFFNHFQSIEHEGLIWVMGALEGNNYPYDIANNYVWIFNPMTNEWTQGPEIPPNRVRGSTGAVVYNGKFYLVGGNTNGHAGGYVPWFDEFDPETGVWTTLTDAPRARDHFHAVLIGNELYTIGGRQTGDPGGSTQTAMELGKPLVAEIDIYNFSTGQWRTLATDKNLPTPRAGASVVNFNGKLVVIGGEVYQELVDNVLTTGALKITEEFDPSTSTWNRISDLNHQRHGQQALVSGNGIHIVGGSPNASGGSQKNMEYLGVDNPTGISLVMSDVITPNSVDVQENINSLIQLDVSNGNMGVFVRSMAISGPNANDFSIISGELSGVLLKANSSHNFEMAYSGISNGAVATLSINYGSSDQLDVLLNGPLVLNTNWIDKDEDVNYTARHECSFVQAGDKFFLMGGRENSRTIDIYNYTGNSWTSLIDSAPVEFNHFQATEYKGIIWVIGAFKDNGFPNETPAEFIWTFNPSNGDWVQGPQIPVGRRRGSSGLSVFNDKFYIVAGNTQGHNGGYVPWLDVFDPFTGVWTALANAPRARDHFHTAVIDDKLYVAGGRLSGGTGGTFGPTIPEVDVYDLTAGSWSTLPSGQNIPTPRASASTVNFNGKLMVIGGETEVSGPSLKITEEYDPATQSWQQLSDMNFPRQGTQAIVSGNGVFTLAGSPVQGGGNQKNMEYLGVDAPVGTPSVQSTVSAPGLVQIVKGTTGNIDVDIATGNVGVIVSSILLSGPDSGDFNWVSGNLTNQLLAPNTTHTLAVDFIGTIEGEIATLTINYGLAQQLIIALEGNLTPVGDSVTSFTLVNSVTDVDMFEMTEDMQIDIADIQGIDLNIRANTNPPSVGSVVLSLTGPVNNTRTEGVAPYALFGDSGGNYFGNPFPLGNYTMNATPFSGSGGSGTPGNPLTLQFSIVTGNQQPVAVANAIPLSGDIPLDVAFTGSGSTDDVGVTSYLWDFKDGNTSTLADPSHTFVVEGTYAVELTVGDVEGLNHSTSVSITVSQPPVNQPPVAVASATPLSGDVPMDVAFMGSGSTDDVGVTSYLWDFKDGNTSTLADPSHTFAAVGTYAVDLTVGDVEGLTHTSTLNITVNDPLANQPPVAVAGATPLSGDVPLDVVFTGSGSTDDVGVTSYLWDFKDGNTSTVADPSHFFAVAGTYAVDLTVGDVEGLTHTTSVSITASSTNLPPNVTNPGTQTNDEGEIVSLQIIATDASTSLLYLATGLPPTLTINPNSGLISGTINDGTGGSNAFLEQNGLVVIEAESGTLVPNWTLTNTGGETGILGGTNSFSVQNGGTIPYEVTITAPGVYRFNWNSFYSGGSSADQNDSWLRFPNDNDVWFFGYKGVPVSEASLISNVQGAQSNTVFPIGSSRITAGTTPNGNGSNGYFKIYLSGGTSEVYQWEAFTSDNDTHNIYVWFVNPGTYTMEISERSSGHAIDRIALYKVDGTSYSNAQLTAAPESPKGSDSASVNSPYNVEVTVTDDDVAPASSSVQFTWNVLPTGNQAAVAIASATPLSGNSPLNVTFTGSNSTDDVGITSYFWDFGDGNTSTLADPSHTFATGVYNVVLSVLDIEGLGSSDTVVITASGTESTQSFTLVNADTDTDIMDMTEGLQIDITSVQGILLNIRANTNPPVVGSVSLSLTGPVNNTRTEGVAPYALFGDSGGNYFGSPFSLGNYTMSATPFSGSGGSGVPGTPLTIQFSVVDQSANKGIIAGTKSDPDEDSGLIGENSTKISPLFTQLFPNPAAVEVDISVSDASLNIVEFYLYDMNGRLVRRYNHQSVRIDKNLYRFNIFGLENGIYFVKLRTDTARILTYRLMVRN